MDTYICCKKKKAYLYNGGEHFKGSVVLPQTWVIPVSKHIHIRINDIYDPEGLYGYLRHFS